MKWLKSASKTFNGSNLFQNNFFGLVRCISIFIYRADLLFNAWHRRCKVRSNASTTFYKRNKIRKFNIFYMFYSTHSREETNVKIYILYVKYFTLQCRKILTFYIRFHSRTSCTYPRFTTLTFWRTRWENCCIYPRLHHVALLHYTGNVFKKNIGFLFEIITPCQNTYILCWESLPHPLIPRPQVR